MNVLPRTVLPFAVLAAFAAGQQADPERGVVLGWVEGEDGAKRPGATVVLISRPIPVRDDIGELDRIEVRTDERGRFRAACLRGRGYSVWAHWPDGEVRMVTRVADDVVPGPPVRLHEAEPFAPPKLVFEGLDTWRARGPLSVMAFAMTGTAYGVPLEVVDDRATIPLLPGVAWHIEVRGANGLLILRRRAARGLETKVTLPEPVEVDVRIKDDQQQPVADAVLKSMPCYTAGGRDPRMTATVVGKTDAEGRASLVLPSCNALTGRAGTQVLRCEREGYATALAVVPARGKRVADVVMVAGTSVRGQLVDAAGEPMADTPVYLEHPVMLSGSGNSRFGAPLQLVRTDAQGRFVQHGCHPGAGCRVMLVMSPQQARRVGVTVEPGRALAPLLWIAARTSVERDVDFGTIAMHEVAMCRLEVVDHAGVPATEARVRLIHDSGFDLVVDYVTDRVGRLQFAYPDESSRVGVFVKGGGIAIAELPERGRPLRIELSETREIRGRVLDVEGKPAANAFVQVWRQPPGLSYDMDRLALSSFGRSEPTGEDGRFVLTVPLDDVAFTIRARWRPLVGGAMPKISRLHSVAPNVGDVELVVR